MLTHDDWAIIVEVLEYMRRRLAQYTPDVQGNKSGTWKQARMERLDGTLARARAMLEETGA